MASDTRTGARRPTIRDVAARASVSLGTVSNVLNQPSRVNSEMRVRVERAIHDLGFRPSAIAKNLRESRTNTIGLILSDITTPFAAQVARRTESLASRAGLSVVFADTDERISRTRASLSNFEANGVEGIILAPAGGSHAFMAEYVARGWPMVAVNRRPAGIRLTSVLTDHEGGAREATHHLIGHGHERVGVVCRAANLSSIRDRLSGYFAALREAGIDSDRKLVAVEEPSLDGGQRAVDKLFAHPNAPTAIMSFTSIMTVGILVALRDRGMEIPRDVAFIGFDDGPWGMAVTPPITSVALRADAVAYRAFRVLRGWIGTGHAPEESEHRISTHLVVRSSCGCPESDQTNSVPSNHRRREER